MIDLDVKHMARALELGRGGDPSPNPHVGCVIAQDDAVVGEGYHATAGAEHAEIVALKAAGKKARGATLYATLEPCNHVGKTPPCVDAIVAAGIKRVVIGRRDPNPRVTGGGLERLEQEGVEVKLDVLDAECKELIRPWAHFVTAGRSYLSLKLAMSLDGRIALPSGESRWITGEDARAHVHRQRAGCDMILVGRGTLEADAPRLDVRLPGLEDRSPRRALLTRRDAPEGWTRLGAPEEVFALGDVNDLLVEGGAGAASAFLAADLVDRMLIYRAPILVGEGKSALGYIGLTALADAHGRWELSHGEMLGRDRLEVYERVRS